MKFEGGKREFNPVQLVKKLVNAGLGIARADLLQIVVVI